ncbi:MAG TPA: hypothetical protein VME44_27060 [Streptosporangiaceae bacterium]|nr:hypothetical protein [Streptosporangiaceae bacterium]
MRRVGRMLVGDDNPLRRGVDKLESAVITSLIIAFLIAAPLLAIFAAGAVGAAGTTERNAESQWRPVTATLQQSAAEGTIGLDGDWETAWVKAQWTIMPGGAKKTGQVAVALNAQAGQHVTVYVTPTGQLTHEPLTRAEVAERTVMAAVACPVALAVVLTIAIGATRILANRRRMAGWAREWKATGPRWSSLR